MDVVVPEDFDDSVVDLPLLPHLFDVRIPFLSTWKKGASSRGSGEFLFTVFCIEGMVVFKICENIVGVISGPTTRKKVIVWGEETVLDSSSFLPLLPFPRSSWASFVEVELDESVGGCMTRHCLRGTRTRGVVLKDSTSKK